MADLLEIEDQDWLINALTDLVRAKGEERFLSAPLLEPNSQFFPDEWEPSIRGVELLARRVLFYAGLEHLQPHVSTFSQTNKMYEMNEFGGAKSWGHEGAAAYFTGIDGRRCCIAVAEERINEPEVLIATLCHEVAHAWRTVHNLVTDDRDEDERLTDVTTVYLGFGVLTANGSYMCRTSGELIGSYAITRWSQQRVGYLPPAAMAFLLAVQSLARSMGWWQRRRLCRLLEPNQANFYRRSVSILRCRSDLPSRLLISAISHTAPMSRSLPSQLLKNQPVCEKPQRKPNEGHHVYRVKRSKVIPYAFWGAMLGLIAGLYAIVTSLDFQIFFTAILIGAGISGLVGRSKQWDYCSDNACGAEIKTGATECLRCGGFIRGTIKHRNERLDRDEGH